MKLDEFVEDVMNLDTTKESMDDNRSHSQDQSTVCSNSFNIDTQHLASFKDIIFLLNYIILNFGLKCMRFFQSVKNLFIDECYIFVDLYYFECGLKTCNVCTAFEM